MMCIVYGVLTYESGGHPVQQEVVLGVDQAPLRLLLGGALRLQSLGEALLQVPAGPALLGQAGHQLIAHL